MKTSQPVQAKLTELNIPFEIVNHPPAIRVLFINCGRSKALRHA
ncbi:hypothetical protein [Pediococcus acidilactici]